MKQKSGRYTVAVDFDGVLHAHESAFEARHIIKDEPIPGAIEWLFHTIQKMDVVIFSCRATSWRGRSAIRKWLKKHAGAIYYPSPGSIGIEDVRITAVKPPALVYLDDRAIRFEGLFPSVEDIHRARPWNK